jgi:hypothetical protein
LFLCSIKHYGYEFNYQTLLLDSPADINPVPADLINLMADKLLSFNEALKDDSSLFKPESITQLTVNEYFPDQGIAPHIGTSRLILDH